MAHFAEINNDSLVLRVLVTDSNDPAGDKGYSWLLKNFGGQWVETSYETNAGIHALGGIPLRKNYAGVGFTYDKKLDAFIPPKTYESWVINQETCQWKPPIEMPSDAKSHPDDEGKSYLWDESIMNWAESPEPDTNLAIQPETVEEEN